MEDLIEENPKKEEKKAFYVGLITVFALLLIVALTIFFVRGCSEKTDSVKEVNNNESGTEVTTDTVTTQATNPSPGSVAGQNTEAQATPQVSGKTYTVQSGDTLYEIAKKFNVSWQKIAEANGIENAGALKVGKQIIIPSE